MAESRAVVDVVVTKALTDEFLKEIGFFVGAFCATETRHAGAAIDVFETFERPSRQIERLVPLSFPKHFLPVSGIDVQALGGRIIAADQRFGQTVRMVDIVKPKTPFDAQTSFIGRAVDSFDILHFAVLDLERHLTSHAAERTDAFDLFVKIRAVTLLGVIQHGGRHQGASRAGLHAFTAGHASTRTHRVGQVKHRVGIMPTPCHANHVIDLHFAAGAHAEATGNAGIQIYPHRDVTVVEQGNAAAFDFGKTAFGYAIGRSHVPQMTGAIM